jgi:hypothetical protein
VKHPVITATSIAIVFVADGECGIQFDYEPPLPAGACVIGLLVYRGPDEPIESLAVGNPEWWPEEMKKAYERVHSAFKQMKKDAGSAGAVFAEDQYRTRKRDMTCIRNG